jgi:hypothetical protein
METELQVKKTKDGVEAWAFPPMRQKQGAWTGHGTVSSI